jgi:hypothetical protein
MDIVMKVCTLTVEGGGSGFVLMWIAAEFIMSGTDEGIQGRLKGRSVVTKELIEKAKLQEQMLPVSGGTTKLSQRLSS